MSTSTMDKLLASATRQEVLLTDILRTLQALHAVAVRTEARDVTARVVSALATCTTAAEVAALWAEASVWVKPLAAAHRNALWRRAVLRYAVLVADSATPCPDPATALRAAVAAYREAHRPPLERLQVEIAASGTPDTCLAVWRANRTVIAVMTKGDRTAAWKALVDRVAEVGKMTNAEPWVRKQLEQLDAKGASP